MFKRAFFAAFALIAIAGSATYWFTIRVRPQDIASYHKLVQESTDLRTRQALEDQPAHQLRRGVQKDIWTQDETRHFQIQSEQSELTLSQKKDHLIATEELKNIRCALGDDTLTADEGIYLYPAQQFIAQNHCHLTQGQNYIDGTRVHIDLPQEIVTYENAKGTSGPFQFTSKNLIWHKKENKLYLTDHVTIEQPGQFTLHADKGTLTLAEFQPTLLVLEGNIRLISTRIQNKQSCAAADTLTYRPIEKTISLTSPKKVLFWQEGLSLSASEVLIRENQNVEGHGDVHFDFDLEEQNTIDQIFKQFL